MVKNGNFTFLSTVKEFILADQLADLSPQNCHLVVKNGNFTFLSTMLEFILADQLADLPPQLSIDLCNMDVRPDIGISTGRSTPTGLPSSGQEWQFYMSFYC